MKTLLAKKYALPTQVVTALIRFFMKFGGNFAPSTKTFDEDDSMGDEEETNAGGEALPVMWH